MPLLPAAFRLGAGRSAAFVALALATATATAGIAGAVAVACASFEAAPAAGDGGGAASGDGGVQDCPPGAFCDSFDDDGPLPRAWKLVQLRGNAKLEVIKDAGLDGSGALVVSVASDGLDQAAYLQLDRGKDGPETYTVVLSFAARVMAAGTAFVLGPRYHTNDGTPLGDHDMILDFHGGGTRLDHYTPGCDGGCGVPSKEPAVGDGWHRYVLTLDVRPFNTLDYGDLLYEIDGFPVVSDHLTFPMSKPKVYAFQFGVTFTSGKVAGTIAFDDVSLVIKP
jgi:hypothetical protein